MQIGGPGKVEVMGLVVQEASISVTTAKDIGHKKSSFADAESSAWAQG